VLSTGPTSFNDPSLIRSTLGFSFKNSWSVAIVPEIGTDVNFSIPLLDASVFPLAELMPI
jgi:hypothetical protein